MNDVGQGTVLDEEKKGVEAQNAPYRTISAMKEDSDQ
jgi:hypothetical protein